MVLSLSNPSVCMAENVQACLRPSVAAHHEALASTSTMNRDSQTRFTAAILFLVTAAAIILAWINFRKESQFVPPYDGVWWLEQNGNIVADRVDPNGPGAGGEINPGDILIAIDGRETATIAVVTSELYHDGVWTKATY